MYVEEYDVSFDYDRRQYVILVDGDEPMYIARAELEDMLSLLNEADNSATGG